MFLYFELQEVLNKNKNTYIFTYSVFFFGGETGNNKHGWTPIVQEPETEVSTPFLTKG